jgi:uncharacterized protein
MWKELGVAVALLLVVEGILPFANPEGLRRMLQSVSQLSDTQLRFAGISSMLLGVLLLYILRS